MTKDYVATIRGMRILTHGLTDKNSLESDDMEAVLTIIFSLIWGVTSMMITVYMFETFPYCYITYRDGTCHNGVTKLDFYPYVSMSLGNWCLMLFAIVINALLCTMTGVVVFCLLKWCQMRFFTRGGFLRALYAQLFAILVTGFLGGLHVAYYSEQWAPRVTMALYGAVMLSGLYAIYACVSHCERETLGGEEEDKEVV